MPLIRCTARLLKELGRTGKELTEQVPGSTPGDWYAHLFFVERRKCLLFINEATLFVCVAFDVRKRDISDIFAMFRQLLSETLAQESFAPAEIEYLLQLHESLSLGKAQNRSVISSLNNRVGDLKFMVENRGGLGFCNPVELTHWLNETPMRPIGYANGLEMMRSILDGRVES